MLHYSDLHIFGGTYVTLWLPWRIGRDLAIHYSVLACRFPCAQSYELQFVLFRYKLCFKLKLDLKLTQQYIFSSGIPCAFFFYSFFCFFSSQI